MSDIRQAAYVRAAQANASQKQCALHGVHKPAYLYTEEHHIVPQAWQHWWHPPGKPLHAGVWDPRTVACCRTGHGNVHVFIVAYMQNLLDASDQDRAQLLHNFKLVEQHLGVGRSHHEERSYAQQALLRWQEWGGSLVALRDLGMYGGI